LQRNQGKKRDGAKKACRRYRRHLAEKTSETAGIGPPASDRFSNRAHLDALQHLATTRFKDSWKRSSPSAGSVLLMQAILMEPARALAC
jgi:hypothetical protein